MLLLVFLVAYLAEVSDLIGVIAEWWELWKAFMVLLLFDLHFRFGEFFLRGIALIIGDVNLLKLW